MHIDLIRSLWGVDAPWEIVFPTYAAQGYKGIEWGVSLDPNEQKRLTALLAEYKLDFVAQVFTNGPDLASHIASGIQQIDAAIECGARQITLHGWRDGSSFDDGCGFIEAMLAVAQHHTIPIAHETHRSRLFFNPWNTVAYLSRYPEVQICADYSHWVVVAERLLPDAEALMQFCAQHVHHLHARVGHAQGPQVGDPRLPRFAQEVDAHEHWWRMIYQAKQQQGATALTVTPEYGPPPYQATDPVSNLPFVPLTDLVDWQAQRIRELFSASM